MSRWIVHNKILITQNAGHFVLESSVVVNITVIRYELSSLFEAKAHLDFSNFSLGLHKSFSGIMNTETFTRLMSEKQDLRTATKCVQIEKITLIYLKPLGAMVVLLQTGFWHFSSKL